MINLSIPEMVVYAVMLLTSCQVAWQMAKYGWLEIGIQRPPNTLAMSAAFIGAVTVLAAGYAERYGHFSLSLMKEDRLTEMTLIFLGCPTLLLVLARYVLIPKGLPEYNRARIRTQHWTIGHFRPGVKLETEGKQLADFSRAKRALEFFDQAIEAQSRGTRGMITVAHAIDEEQAAWDGRMSLPCPNCGMRSRVPVMLGRGDGECTMCGCLLGFKIDGDAVYLTAFGAKVRSAPGPGQMHNIAIAYAEKGLLLRMMNLFSEARVALSKADSVIDELLAVDSENRSFLELKSLIVFRKGEISHALKEETLARQYYDECLALDRLIGNDQERQLVLKLIRELG